MRAVLVVIFVSVFLGFGSASQAGFFPDLPGSDMLEEATAGKGADVSTSGSAPEPQDRVPAPEPQGDDPTAVTESAVGDLPIETVTEMPGGGGLPLIKELTPATAPKENVGLLAAIVVMATVLWTRFLYRLNTIR